MTRLSLIRSKGTGVFREACRLEKVPDLLLSFIVLLSAKLLVANVATARADDDSRLLELERAALTERGDVERGERLFFDRQHGTCTNCHRLNGEGTEVGPNLESIGGKYDRPQLIESLLKPSQQIVEGFRTTTFVTSDGQVQTGIVADQSERSVTFYDLEGKRHQLERSQLAESYPGNLSLMPNGIADGWTVGEFVDLIAYLESLGSDRSGRFGAGISGPIQVPQGFEISVLATGFDGATALECLPDGRIFVCEQPGQVRVVKEGRLLSQPLIELPVDSSWERGVIGITIDPQFERNGFVYVCWVARDPYPHHVVSRFVVRDDVADPSSELRLLQGDDQRELGGSVPNGHQGGALHFGKDGCLYIAIGEQTAGRPAQRMDSLLGKILRVHHDGAIPADNPFLDQTNGKYQAIWAVGCRNPFTFAVHPRNGTMLINDVGGNFEEINVGAPGANFGWPTADHGPVSDQSRFASPIHWYPQASISGGDFAPQAWPAPFAGQYFFADFVRGWIHAIDLDTPQQPTEFAHGFRRPVDMRFAESGELLVLLRNAWVIDEHFEPGTGSLLSIRPEQASRQED